MVRMEGVDRDRKEAGFRARTRIDDARDRLREAIVGSVLEPLATELVGIAAADGRVLAESITADRNVPHYERVAADGFAVRAADTFGASERSPATVRLRDAGPIESGTATAAQAGTELPEGADAVVALERADVLEADGDLEIADAVTEDEHVTQVGADVAAGQQCYDAGHRLRPSDLGLLRSIGLERVRVVARPTVGVVPTGGAVVDAAPDPGETVETNGLTVSQLVERWGGRATHRDVVTDDPEALRVAIQRDLTKDVIVTTGGSSAGERDALPEVVDDLGDVLIHGVAAQPGRSVALGVVADTPVIVLPGPPVACIVDAVQFLRPTLAWLQGRHPGTHPWTRARLERKIPSEPGVRTFARVKLEPTDAGDPDASQVGSDGSGGEPDGPERTAVPTRTGGAGSRSSVAFADGWVVVEEDREGIPAGETVAVEDWESHP